MDPTLIRIKNLTIEKLKSLSFKTGLLILSLCIPFYVLSFAQMALNISYTLKAILWIVFFGLAKTFQYGGLLIIGVEGVKKLKEGYFKTFWNKIIKKNKFEETD